MKKLTFIIAILYMGYQFTRENVKVDAYIGQPDNPIIKVSNHGSSIAYDWVNSREINEGDLDTLIQEGNNWVNKNTIESHQEISYSKVGNKKVQNIYWINPPGREHEHYKPESAQERQWQRAEQYHRETQALQNSQLTEDDIREIIRQEKGN